jgi:hypothetical protein
VSLGRLAASAILAADAVFAVRDVVMEFPGAVTGGQKLATFLELGHGMAALAALAAMWLYPSRARPLFLLWGALVTATAAAASMFWGGAGIAAAAAGAVGAAALCLLIAWLALGRLRRPRGPEQTTRSET